MKQRNLAIWPLFKLRPEEEELRFEVQKEWNQEEESFQIGLQQSFENAHERLERLAPNFGDLKKLVL